MSLLGAETVNVFFTTYRLMVLPQEVLDLVIERFAVPAPSKPLLSADDVKTYQALLHSIQTW